jgi:hypothetical protein
VEKIEAIPIIPPGSAQTELDESAGLLVTTDVSISDAGLNSN